MVYIPSHRIKTNSYSVQEKKSLFPIEILLLNLRVMASKIISEGEKGKQTRFNQDTSFHFKKI